MSVMFFVITFVFLFFSRALDIDGSSLGGLSVKNLLLFCCVFSIGVDLVIRRYKFELPYGVFGPLALGIAISGFSVWLIHTFGLKDGFQFTQALISLKTKLVDPFVMLLISFIVAANSRSPITIMRLLVFTVFVGSILTVVDIFDVPDLGLVTVREEDGRVQGVIGSAPEFATIIAATIPITFQLSTQGNSASRFGIFFAVFIMFVALILCATRAPLVGLFGACVLYVLLNSKNRLSTLFAGIAFTAFVIISSTYLLYSTPLWDMVADRFMTGVNTGNLSDLSSGRTDIWSSVLNEMWSRPSSFLYGMGWDTYYQSAGHRYATHSIFLDRFYSLGAIGLFLYVYAYFRILRIFLSFRGATQSGEVRLPFALGLAVTVFLISASFADLEIAEFFIFALIGLGLGQVFQRMKPSSDSIRVENQASRADLPFPIQSKSRKVGY